MDSFVIGIDVGNAGGIVVLRPTGELVESLAMPLVVEPRRRNVAAKRPTLDRLALARILGRYPGAILAVERQQAAPAQGVAATFSIGRSYGTVLGVAAALETAERLAKTVVVEAKGWQALLGGRQRDGRAEIKAAAGSYARTRWPELADVPSAGSGRADAACIAEYARRIERGELVAPLVRIDL